ncbi:MAG: EamA family transporter, partial [Hapalosiphonaceae cyanobacterium JJU2]
MGMKSKTLGLTYASICVILWSLIPIVSRFGQVKLDNFQFLFWSNLLSFIVVSLAAFYLNKLNAIKKIRQTKIIQLILLGTIGCAFYYLCLYYGYAHAHGLEVLIIQYSWPFLMVVLSSFILREKITFGSLFAALIGFLGIGIVLTKGNLFEFN